MFQLSCLATISAEIFILTFMCLALTVAALGSHAALLSISRVLAGSLLWVCAHVCMAAGITATLRLAHTALDSGLWSL